VTHSVLTNYIRGSLWLHWLCWLQHWCCERCQCSGADDTGEEDGADNGDNWPA
jgi:hypothetical protein